MSNNLVILIVLVAIVIALVIWGCLSSNTSILQFTPLVDSQQQVPTIIVPTDVSDYTVDQAPVSLLIPFGPNLNLGHQITFYFNVASPVLIGVIPDPANPPPSGSTATLSDNSTGNWSSIIYNPLPLSLIPTPSSMGVVNNVASVTFTLTAIAQNQSAYFWKGESIFNQYKAFPPGSYTIPVPPGTSTMKIAAWGGGGAGGKNSQTQDHQAERAGAGGGAGAAFLLVQPVSGINSITLSVGQGSKNASQGGQNTVVSFSNVQITASGGAAGNDGNTTVPNPAVGGSGGIVTYSVNNKIITPPSSVTIFNGSKGGDAGPVHNGEKSIGGNGETSAYGYSGGAGGYIDPNDAGVLVSGPGGGGGGFFGPGARAPSFKIPVPIIILYHVENSGSSAGVLSGAGGAGEGPISVARVANGGDGNAIVIFS